MAFLHRGHVPGPVWLEGDGVGVAAGIGNRLALDAPATLPATETAIASELDHWMNSFRTDVTELIAGDVAKEIYLGFRFLNPDHCRDRAEAIEAPGDWDSEDDFLDDGRDSIAHVRSDDCKLAAYLSCLGEVTGWGWSALEATYREACSRAQDALLSETAALTRLAVSLLEHRRLEPEQAEEEIVAARHGLALARGVDLTAT